jgi:linoleoyl-CoA desaturase
VAITDIKQYAHLTESDIEQLGRELDAIRADVEQSRGESDARYIRRVIRVQRTLAAGGRAALFVSHKRSARWSGILMLALAKILENMELGHNIIHGQWDWMNDPEIHSTEWEWDTQCPSSQWKRSHNFVHHKYTNVLGLDSDVGYGIMRVTRDVRWAPWMIGNPIYNLLLGTLFEWGVALHHIEAEKLRKKQKTWAEARKDLRVMGRKMARQVGKDYVVYPALAGKNWKHTMKANAVANLIRNYWSYMVIFCGHFPDGAEKFTREEFEHETRSEWYLRQMLGSANFKGGKLMTILAGNLNYQIEHHLFPDLPSNRYAEISVRVRELCDRYDLPYTTGSLPKQYGQSFWTILKLALPDRFLRDSADDAPETRSERKFAAVRDTHSAAPEAETVRNGHRRGLRTAIEEVRMAS